MHRFLFLTLCAVALPVLTGCYKEPTSAPSGVPLDKQLVGHWMKSEDSPTGRLTIFETHTKEYIIWIDSTVCRAYPIKYDGKDVLEIEILGDTDPPKKSTSENVFQRIADEWSNAGMFVLASYSVSEDRLTFAISDFAKQVPETGGTEEDWKKAVEDKAIIFMEPMHYKRVKEE